MAVQVVQPKPPQNGLGEILPVGGAIVGGILGAGGAGAISGGTASGAGAAGGAALGASLGNIAGNFIDPQQQAERGIQTGNGGGGSLVKPTIDATASADTMGAATRRQQELQNISALKTGLAQAKQDPDTYKQYGSYLEDALQKANTKYT